MIFHLKCLFFIGVLSLVKSDDGDCITTAYPPSSSTKVKTAIVNLDLQPEQRWQSIVKPKAAQIQKLITNLKVFLGDVVGEKTAQALMDFVDNNMGTLDDTFPEPYGGELRGIATATNIKLGEIVLYNIFYEIFTLCTSIVAQDSSGKLYHARNLDFGLFMGWDIKNNTWLMTETLRPLIINVDYQRSGKTVYKAVHFAGYVGVITGIKPGMFTLTVNERFNIDGGYIGIIEWLMGDRKAKWLGFHARDVLENGKSFADAKKMLDTQKLIAPVYFILGGNTTNQGVIETRARESLVDSWQMTNAGGWYILETNYDHWEKPMIIDDRRTPANTCMQKMSQKNVGFRGLFNVLSSKPVLNKLTTYTTLMQVDEGQMETWLQNCEDPCYPW